MAIQRLGCLLLICNFFIFCKFECFISGNVNYCDRLEDLHNFSKVKSLTLTGTKLEKLNIIPFQSAKNIEVLDISSAVNEISEDAFINYENLRTLVLRLNHLEIIKNRIFQNLNISRLFITESGVKQIEDQAFVNLPNLIELRLTNNNLSEITKKYFSNLNITSLALSNNQITKIEKLAFFNLQNLSKLYLDNNLLTEFNVIEYLPNGKNLERLWLHVNKFTQITNYMLEGLVKLKILNLGFNQISSIEPQSFAQTPQLTTLVLSNNFLQIIDGSILPILGLHNLKILYLDHNRLMFLSTNFLFRLKSLKSISIGGNPWLCSCLDLVLKFLADNSVKLNCDKEYFSGEKPICVASETSCVYNYDLKSREIYENSSMFYPKTKFCLL